MYDPDIFTLSDVLKKIGSKARPKSFGVR